MPAEAIKAGGVDKVMPLGAIAPEVVRLCHA
jgi:chemotaxis response regulator CheB